MSVKNKTNGHPLWSKPSADLAGTAKCLKLNWENKIPLGNYFEEMLKDPAVTVADLIEEDSFFQEYKAGNARLLKFLSKKKNMKDLLSYILEEPPADASHNRGHKYPFMISDLLASDNSDSYSSK